MTYWLKETRAKKGFTQESFAEAVGIPKSTYTSYEQGHRRPSISNAKIIATELEFPWTIFFDQEVLETYCKKVSR